MRRVAVVLIKTVMNDRRAVMQSSGYVGNYQAALTCTVMIVALAAHSYARPFNDSWIDFGDAAYITATFFSSLLGVCFSAARTDQETDMLEQLFFVNFYATVAVTLLLLWRDVEIAHPSVRQRRRQMLPFVDVVYTRVETFNSSFLGVAEPAKKKPALEAELAAAPAPDRPAPAELTAAS